MTYVHLVPVIANDRGKHVLLVQRNIYLPPRGGYQYATIARNAVQKLFCGGRARTGENLQDAAARELLEQLGVRINAPASALKELHREGEDAIVYHFDGSGIDANEVNERIASGKLPSAIANSVAWCPIEAVFGQFGNLPEYVSLPWVTQQILRAQEAGFHDSWINRRVNEPHDIHARAAAHLLLEGVSRGGAPLGRTS